MPPPLWEWAWACGCVGVGGCVGDVEAGTIAGEQSLPIHLSSAVLHVLFRGKNHYDLLFKCDKEDEHPCKKARVVAEKGIKKRPAAK